MSGSRSINSINDAWDALEAREMNVDVYTQISLFIEDHPEMLTMPKRDFPPETNKLVDEFDEINRLLDETDDIFKGQKRDEPDSSKTLLHLLAEIAPDANDIDAVEDYKIFVEDMLKLARVMPLDDQSRTPLDVAENSLAENTAFIEASKGIKKEIVSNKTPQVANKLVNETSAEEELQDIIASFESKSNDLFYSESPNTTMVFEIDLTELLAKEKNDTDVAKIVAKHLLRYGMVLVENKKNESGISRTKAAECFEKLLSMDNNSDEIKEYKDQARQFLDQHHKFAKEFNITGLMDKNLESADKWSVNLLEKGMSLVNDKKNKNNASRAEAAECFKELLNMDNNLPGIKQLKETACKFLDKHYKFSNENNLVNLRDQTKKELGINQKTKFFEKMYATFHKPKVHMDKASVDVHKPKGPKGPTQSS